MTGPRGNGRARWDAWPGWPTGGGSVAAAIAIDATVVRMLLVPAVMHLLSRANWWLPDRSIGGFPSCSGCSAPRPERVPADEVQQPAQLRRRRCRVGVVHGSAYPGGDALGRLGGGELAGVVAGLDVRPQPGGEPLVPGDRVLGGGAAPGGPGAEPAGEDGVGAVQGAEADGADELAGGERLQLAGHQRSAQDGHAAVQRDGVGEPEPGVAPGVPAERGDLQGDVGVEDVAAR